MASLRCNPPVRCTWEAQFANPRCKSTARCTWGGRPRGVCTANLPLRSILPTPFGAGPSRSRGRGRPRVRLCNPPRAERVGSGYKQKARAFDVKVRTSKNGTGPPLGQNPQIESRQRRWDKTKGPGLRYEGPDLEERQLPTLPPGGAVPSAMAGLTSLFGMGRGGSPPL